MAGTELGPTRATAFAEEGNRVAYKENKFLLAKLDILKVKNTRRIGTGGARSGEGNRDALETRRGGAWDLRSEGTVGESAGVPPEAGGSSIDSRRKSKKGPLATLV